MGRVRAEEKLSEEGDRRREKKRCVCVCVCVCVRKLDTVRGKEEQIV